MALFDASTAFDTVDHEILLRCLSRNVLECLHIASATSALSYSLSPVAASMLVHSFAVSHLDYCSANLYDGLCTVIHFVGCMDWDMDGNDGGNDRGFRMRMREGE